MKWPKIIFLLVTLGILSVFVWERPTNILWKKRDELDALPTWTPSDIYAPTSSGKCIVWVNNTYPPYGSSGNEWCTHAINQALLAKGHEVWIGVPGFPAVVYEGVRCFDLRDRAILNVLLARTHVIGACSLVYKPAAVRLAQRFETAFIDCIHTHAIRRSYWEDLGEMEKRFWVVFNTHWMREHYAESWVEQSIILHPPVDWRQYTIPSEQRKPVYVSLINCNENKGGRQLVELAKKAPEFAFLGVLGGYDAQIQKTGIKNLTYYPHTPNIRAVYEKTWVLLVLSKWETYGRVAVEAMSSGIPVIACPLVGIKEACGDAAIYHERDDIAGIIASLRKLRNDSTYYQQMSNKALERAKSMNTAEDMESLCTWITEKVVPSAPALEIRKVRPLGFLEGCLPLEMS